LQVFRTIDEMRAWRRALRDAVGLVPTMGYLHDGHLSLVRAARGENARTVVSIFVNPAQFAPNEDLERYPRDEARDLSLLEAAGVNAVFAPDVAAMYPEGFSTYVTVEGLTQRLEGASRPTHFRGVTTVVLKLLNIVQAQRAYFGQKDAQQLAVIRRMVRDLAVPVEIVGMPIVREPDGLAMSSRNAYLTPEQRRAAPVLARALSLAERLFDQGVRDARQIRDRVEETIRSEPLAGVEYVSVADAGSLEELTVLDRAALVSLAVRFGATRLIDNTTLDPGPR
jgi:pantoate--beta-alanine ligase